MLMWHGGGSFGVGEWGRGFKTWTEQSKGVYFLFCKNKGVKLIMVKYFLLAFLPRAKVAMWLSVHFT